MRIILRSRPSPAIIVAVLALVAAVAGTAVAGPTAGSSKITKKKVAKIADKEIQKLAPTLNVASANTATTAGTANAAFSTFHNNGIDFPNSLGTIATLNIPTAGSYVVNAKFWALNVSATNSPNDQCTLTAGDDADNQQFDATGSPLGDQAPVPLQLVHTFTTPGSVVLACSDSGVGSVQALDTKITAVQVANLTNTAF